MRVAISGSSGFIGAHILKALRDNAQAQTQLLKWREESWELSDFEGEEKKREATLHLDVDYVLLVGASMPKSHRELNDATAAYSNISSAFQFTQIPTVRPMRILYFSTVDVYPFHGTVSEHTEPRPSTLYGDSKLVSEKLLQEFAEREGHTLSVLRIGTVFGPGEAGSKKVIPTMLKSAVEMSALEVMGEGLEHRSFLFVRDLVTMVTHIMERTDVPSPINLVGFRDISIEELAELVSTLSAKPLPILRRPTSKTPRDQKFDKSLMQKVFPQSQTPFETALREELESYQNEALY
jgi:nucleoside-diphosphate-sugar epimerase